MAAASACQFYANNLDLEKLTDLTGATIKMALLASTYTPNTSETGHTVYADLTTIDTKSAAGKSLSQPILKERGLIDFDPIPTLYYTQLLALAMGFDPGQVAAISQIDRGPIIGEIQSEKRLIKEVA